MYTSTISDQTDRGTLARYDGAGPSEYLSDSDSQIAIIMILIADQMIIITTSLIMSPIMKKLPALQPALPKL